MGPPPGLIGGTRPSPFYDSKNALSRPQTQSLSDFGNLKVDTKDLDKRNTNTNANTNTNIKAREQLSALSQASKLQTVNSNISPAPKTAEQKKVTIVENPSVTQKDNKDLKKSGGDSAASLPGSVLLN